MGLHFSKEEFSQRKSKVLQNMKDQNIEILEKIFFLDEVSISMISERNLSFSNIEPVPSYTKRSTSLSGKFSFILSIMGLVNKTSP